MNPKQTALERALEDAVSRALRDNLAPLQRTADELHQAYADLVAACGSTRPTNALPAMLRAQTAASALSAGLSVLSNFVAVALHSRNGGAGVAAAMDEAEAEVSAEPAVQVQPKPASTARHGSVTPAAVAAPDVAEAENEIELLPVPDIEPEPMVAAPPKAAVEVPAFDIAALAPEMQDLHRRANRVAKVAMQDIKLLRPKDVESGRQHKDLCERLRADLDKARKEYDRRFRAISDHPVDYFHHWMLEILAGGDSSALGNYPYPSIAARH